MKKTLILSTFALSVTVCAIALISNSYGQEATFQTATKNKIYLQLEILDSGGKLVGYLEPTVLYEYHPELIDKYLEEKPNKTIVIMDGKKFEQIQFQESGRFGVFHAMAQYEMFSLTNGHPIALLTLIHDGYRVEPGDTFTAYWTIIKPVS